MKIEEISPSNSMSGGGIKSIKSLRHLKLMKVRAEAVIRDKHKRMCDYRTVHKYLFSIQL